MSVAQRVLQQVALSLEGAELTVTNVMVQETTPKRAIKPAQSCASTDASPLHSLEISGFKPDARRDSVEKFIKNKTAGTELQWFDYDASTGVAIVELSNYQGNTLVIQSFPAMLTFRLFSSFAPLNKEEYTTLILYSGPNLSRYNRAGIHQKH